MKVKILKAFAGYKAGHVFHVEVDGDGVPVDRFWRRRLADSRADFCLEILPEEKPKKKGKEKADEVAAVDPVTVDNVEAE